MVKVLGLCEDVNGIYYLSVQVNEYTAKLYYGGSYKSGEQCYWFKFNNGSAYEHRTKVCYYGNDPEEYRQYLTRIVNRMHKQLEHLSDMYRMLGKH